MAWLTEDGIRGKFNIQPNAFVEQIESAIASGAMRLRRLVDPTAYAEAIDATPPVDPDDLLRYETLVEAHSWLTMYYLATAVGTRIARDGSVKAAQDAGSPAMNTQIFTNQYLTPAEMNVKRQEYLDEAMAILGPYTIVDSSAVVRTALPTAITVTADW